VKSTTEDAMFLVETARGSSGIQGGLYGARLPASDHRHTRWPVSVCQSIFIALPLLASYVPSMTSVHPIAQVRARPKLDHISTSRAKLELSPSMTQPPAPQ
jgi:hypothetical protein